MTHTVQKVVKSSRRKGLSMEKSSLFYACSSSSASVILLSSLIEGRRERVVSHHHCIEFEWPQKVQLPACFCHGHALLSQASGKEYHPHRCADVQTIMHTFFFVLLKYPMNFGIFGYSTNYKDFYRARTTTHFLKALYWY